MFQVNSAWVLLLVGCCVFCACVVVAAVMLVSTCHLVHCHLFLSARRFNPGSNCLKIASAASLLMPLVGWFWVHFFGLNA